MSALISKYAHFNETDFITDSGSGNVIVQRLLLDVPVFLCNIYALSLDNSEFFHHLAQLLSDMDNSRITLRGDFNQILDRHLGRFILRTSTESSSGAAIRELILDLSLVLIE